MAGSTTYQYILTLNDRMSSALRRAGYMGSNTYDKLIAKQTALNTATTGFTSLLGKMGVAFGAFEFGKKIITAGADIESTRIQFQTLMQDVEKGNAMVQALQDYANVTPFETKPLQDAAKLMLNFGISADKIMPNLQMLGDISGGNTEKLRQLSLAFSQMSSAGRLMGQDLLQMINAGFNPLQEISKRTGRSMALLKKDMEKGLISVDMVEGAFRSATSQGGAFYKMMDKMSDTIHGRWSTLMDKLSLTFMKWGDIANGSVSKIVDGLIVAADWLFANAEGVYKWGKRILWIVGVWKGFILVKKIATAVTTIYSLSVRRANASLFVLTRRLFGASAASGVYSGLMGVASLATNMLALSVRALGRAIYSIPIIGWIAAGISLLIAAFTTLWNKSEKFRGVMYGLGASIKVVWNYIKLFTQFVAGSFKIIWDFIKPLIMGIFNSYKGVVTQAIKVYTTIFKGLWGAIKWVFSAIKTVIVGVFNAISKIVSGIWSAIKWFVGILGKVVTPLKQFVNWIDDNIIAPIADSFEWLGDFFGKIWDGIVGALKSVIKPFVDLWNKLFGNKKISVDIKENYKKGYDRGVEAFRKDKKGKAAKSPALDVGMGSLGMPGVGNIDGSGVDMSGLSDKGKDIAGGGSRPTTINITLSNLVENLSIHSETIREGADEMERRVREALLRVLNSANGVAYGN